MVSHGGSVAAFCHDVNGASRRGRHIAQQLGCKITRQPSFGEKEDAKFLAQRESFSSSVGHFGRAVPGKVIRLSECSLKNRDIPLN
jgi:hypothetical protein